MSVLNDALQSSTFDAKGVAAALDAMSHEARVVEIRTLRRGLFAKLFDARAGVRMDLESIVPSRVAPLQPVRHIGMNNMPLFRPFEKVMYRLPGGGLAGLAAANSLKTFGIKTEVFEAAPALGEIGAAVNASPQAVKALRAIGLGEKVAALKARVEELAKAKKLPKGIKKDAVAKAKKAVADLEAAAAKAKEEAAKDAAAAAATVKGLVAKAEEAAASLAKKK